MTRKLTPGVSLYAAGAEGAVHLYGVDLRGTSAPSLKQVSSLTLPALTSVCGFTQPYYNNVFDPTSTFTLVRLADANGSCAVADTHNVVVHFNDTAATEPTAVDFNPSASPLAVLKENGALAGLVGYDLDSQTVRWYADDTFSNPKVLVSGVAGGAGGVLPPLFTGALSEALPLAVSSVLFFTNGASESALYRLDSAGVATKVYTLPPNDVVLPASYSIISDDSNFYFSDGSRIIQVPIVGGDGTLLYEGSVNSLRGSDGARVSFLSADVAGATPLYSVPVGVLSASAVADASIPFNQPTLRSSILSYIGGGYVDSANVSLLISSSPLNPGDDLAPWSMVLRPDGSVVRDREDNSAFLGAALFDGDTAFQFLVRGITDSVDAGRNATSLGVTVGMVGGGALYRYDIADSKLKPITLDDGVTAYTFKSGTPYALNSLQGFGTLFVTPLTLSELSSNQVAIGGGAGNAGVIDTSSLIFTPLNLPSNLSGSIISW